MCILLNVLRCGWGEVAFGCASGFGRSPSFWRDVPNACLLPHFAPGGEIQVSRSLSEWVMMLIHHLPKLPAPLQAVCMLSQGSVSQEQKMPHSSTLKLVSQGNALDIWTENSELGSSVNFLGWTWAIPHHPPSIPHKVVFAPLSIWIKEWTSNSVNTNISGRQ